MCHAVVSPLWVSSKEEWCHQGWVVQVCGDVIVVCIVFRVVRELEEEPEETVVTEVPELLVFEDNFEYCSCNAAMC